MAEPIVSCALYTASGAPARFTHIDEAAAAWHKHTAAASLLWIDLADPSTTELATLAAAFGLHPLAIEDTQEGHQRAKFEPYGDSAFLVLRPATILSTKEINLLELELFAGPGYLITVHHQDGGRDPARDSFPAISESFTQKAATIFSAEQGPSTAAALAAPYALLHVIVDSVVDSYGPVLDWLEDEADDDEDQIFSGTPISSQDIYALSRSILDLDRGIKPLPTLMHSLTSYATSADLSENLMHQLRDVTDHAQIHLDRLDRLRSIMHEVFSANSTLIAERQGDQTKKISAWAGILFVPSLVAGVYGMNFMHMPELHWFFGYPFAIVLMLLGAAIMYVIFKHKDWV